MTDIQAKYQKLAAEYSKLRSQLPILKKAVLDEQAKEEVLKDELREKETSLRKTEQELESLSFRNQQLSSRVEILQSDLQYAKSKKNSKQQGQSDSHTGDFEASVIGEELHKKIEENAELHKQVFESSAQHHDEVSALQERLMRLDEEAGRHQNTLTKLTAQQTETTQKLIEEKALLQAKLENQMTETKDAQQRAHTAEETLLCVETELRERLNDAIDTIEVKLPFNDLAVKSVGSLNIPCHNRRHQLQSRELITQAFALVKQLTQALSNLYTYSEQRAAMYPIDAQLEPLSDVNKKLRQHLHGNAVPLRQLDNTFRNFTDCLNDDSLTTLETATGLQEFSLAWNTFVQYASKLLPYQLLSLVEECSIPSCTEALGKKNMELHTGLQTFTAVLTKLDTYVTLLATYSGSDCELPRESQHSLFQHLSTGLDQFHQVTRDYSQQFNAKISIEHQLPTASKQLKITDECIVSALISLVTCTGKVSAFFTSNLEYMCRAVSMSRPCHPAVGGFRQRAAQYITSLNRPAPDSVPQVTALHNRHTLFSSTESQDSLTAQVVGYQEKTQKLEADKEHWMLEAQLQQVKYDKQGKRVSDLEKQLKLLQERLSGTAEHTTNDNSTVPVLSRENSIQHSMLGDLNIIPTNEEDSSREELIKRHFSTRIGVLVTQLQQADSKALHFQAESRALHKRLALAQQDRDKWQRELVDANQAIAKLKDELSTTSRSYEGQLSMMSEHLAGMNDKLTTQADEINTLKYQLNHKGDKKSKRK